jgi:hypothetical protein
VSGEFAGGHSLGPPELEPRGGNCLITISYWHDWGSGSFRGEDEVDFRIVQHGPCEAGANEYRENIKGTGAFIGDLCLGGVWDDDCGSGEVYSGSFDFALQWQVTPNPDPDAATMKGTLVILQGYDGFEDLHGVLEFSGRVGREGWAAYSGQVHVDP